MIVLGKPAAPVVLKGVRLQGEAHLLGSNLSGAAQAAVQRDDTILTAPFTGGFAPIVRITGGASPA